MKKVVRSVKSYDDVHLSQGREVEADTEVIITIDGEARTLDLTAANAAKFRKDVASWLMSAQPARSGGRARTRNHPPVCRRPTEGMTPEGAKAFLALLREWARREGRDAEYWPKGKTNYSYGQQLVDDYKAHLGRVPGPVHDAAG